MAEVMTRDSSCSTPLFPLFIHQNDSIQPGQQAIISHELARKTEPRLPINAIASSFETQCLPPDGTVPNPDDNDTTINNEPITNECRRGITPARGQDDVKLVTESSVSIPAENCGTEVKLVESLPSMSSRSKPPLKMMQFRNDGKLCSPTTRAVASITASRPTKIVIVKYGVTTRRRQSLGDKISAILNGSVNMAPKSTISLVPRTSRLAPSVPSHPFFSKTTAILRTEPSQSPAQLLAQVPPPLRRESSKLGSYKISQMAKPQQTCDSIPSTILSNARVSSEPVRRIKTPENSHPLWPPMDMVHVGIQVKTAKTSSMSLTRRKMKQARISVPSTESVLVPWEACVKCVRSQRNNLPGLDSLEPRDHRHPRRLVLSGVQLQEMIKSELTSSTSWHPSIRNRFEALPRSRSAFDDFKCEMQCWDTKYAPRSASNLLVRGAEPFIIRDWLTSLSVTSTSSGYTMKHDKTVHRSKRRKRNDDLDGFLVTSEDDENVVLTDDTEIKLADVPYAQRSSRYSTNKLSRLSGRKLYGCVISGPHGSGKSATVHAVAAELGYEVFEINTGSRRSGKDILDRVGNLTRNHIVPGANTGSATPVDPESMAGLEELTQNEIDSGRQATMATFFQSVPSGQKKQAIPKKKSLATTEKVMETKPLVSQKQSLILLEDVDVIFEEDRGFWTTVLELIHTTRRPVIMTCTDERHLPLAEMELFGIFRLERCTEVETVDYISLLAAWEGHIVPRNLVERLVKRKGCDLRASIAELQFFCQMGLGDKKGGLEWLPIGLNKANGSETRLRIISDNTVVDNSHLVLPGAPPHDQDGHTFATVDSTSGISDDEEIVQTRTKVRASKKFAYLVELERSYAAASLKDLIQSERQDATLPRMADSVRSEYPEGRRILDTQEQDQGRQLSLNICSAISNMTMNDSDHFPEGHVRNSSPALSHHLQEVLHASFDPYVRPDEPAASSHKIHEYGTFDLCEAVQATEVAPYIRTIIEFDLRLEEQRSHLSSALAVATTGSQKAKARTTRASRAALEGGNKANTRRERWFPPHVKFEWLRSTGLTTIDKHARDVVEDIRMGEDVVDANDTEPLMEDELA